MAIIDNIKKEMKKRGISGYRLCKDLGIGDSTFRAWVKGSEPSAKYVAKIAEYFNIPVDFLLKSDIMPSGAIPFISEEMIALPILGRVSGGNGVLAQENIIGYEIVHAKKLIEGETYFWLKVQGDSMSPKIDEGDLVLVKKQESVDNGSLAVVIVNGEDGVVKKVEYGPDWIELHSYNPYYPVRRFEGVDVQEVQVVGLVMMSTRYF